MGTLVLPELKTPSQATVLPAGGVAGVHTPTAAKAVPLPDIASATVVSASAPRIARAMPLCFSVNCLDFRKRRPAPNPFPAAMPTSPQPLSARGVRPAMAYLY